MNASDELHFLIVDDCRHFRDSFRRLLWVSNERFSKHIEEASDGPGALDALQTTDVDCVILDVHIPNGSGIEWLSRLREDAPQAAFIIVSGDGDQMTAVAAMKQGADDYLVKGTITPEALNRAVTKAVERVRMQATIAQQQDALIDAERQRVMLESLATVCHHIGQPITVINMCLDVMRAQETSPAMETMFASCAEAVETVNELLRELQAVREYRTEPYLTPRPDTAAADGPRLLCLSGDASAAAVHTRATHAA